MAMEMRIFVVVSKWSFVSGWVVNVSKPVMLPDAMLAMLAMLTMSTRRVIPDRGCRGYREANTVQGHRDSCQPMLMKETQKVTGDM